MRKLLAVTLGYALVGVLAHYFLTHNSLIIATVISCGLAAFCLFLPRKVKIRLILGLLGAAMCFSWTWAHYELFISPVQQRVGETMTISARVVDYPAHRGGYYRLTLRSTGDNFPHVKMTVYDYSMTSGELRPGDEIAANIKIKSVLTKYGEETDSYISNGFFASGYIDEPIEKSGQWKLSFLMFPKEMAHNLLLVIGRVWPEDVTPFLRALMLGDKSDLYSTPDYARLRLAGMSHIIAVSGMHLSFILGFVRAFTGRKRTTAFICLPLIVIFAAMTGFSPSIVRASIMAGMTLLAPILRRENDHLTSLSAAALLILLINPQTIGSISFQLSFAAMLGIIVIGNNIFAWLRSFRLELGRNEYALPKPIASVTASSIAAAVFTTPISAMHFGYITVYTVFANLLCFWIVSATFVLSYVITILGFAFPTAAILVAKCAAYAPRLIILVSGFVAGLPGRAIYTHDVLTAAWLIFTYGVFFAAWHYRGTERMRFTLPICVTVAGFCLISLLSSASDGMTITAVDVGQGESIAVTTRDCAVVVDCGGGNISGSVATRTCQALSEQGKSRIDLLILTHPHADHINGAEELLTLGMVDRLVLSYDEEHSKTLDKIITLAQSKGTEIYCLSEDCSIACGDLTMNVYYATDVESVNDSGLVVVGSYGYYDFLIMGDAGSSTEAWLTENYEVPDSELLIVGHHGSNTSTSDDFLEVIRPETAIISVGYNTYGHPADRVLQRLQSHGVEVHRTDEEGNVTIRVASGYGD